MGEWQSIVTALSVAFIAFTNLILLLGFLAFFTAIRRLVKKGEHLVEHLEEKKKALEKQVICQEECREADNVEKIASVIDWAIVGYSLLKRFKRRR